MTLNRQEKLKEIKIDQVVHRELLFNTIIKHSFPYKFVEYPELKTWINYLCPDAIMVSRNIVKADIGRVCIKKKQCLRNCLLPFFVGYA